MYNKITVIIVLFLSLIVWCNLGFAANLSDGLVGYWPLDGNGKDVSGNGHDAKLEGGADWVKDGWMNEALMTDGAGGHAVVDAAFELITLDITVVARINGWRTIPWSGIVVGRGPTTFWMGVADNDTLTYVWNDNKAETWDGKVLLLFQKTNGRWLQLQSKRIKLQVIFITEIVVNLILRRMKFPI